MATAHTIQLHTTKLHAMQWKPKGTPSGHAFLCLHGVESHAQWFDRLAQRLANAGHEVIAYDRSGFGKSQSSRGDMQNSGKTVEELLHIRETLLANHDHQHVIGLSWGGILAGYVALQEPSAFDSWNFVAPGWFPRQAVWSGNTSAWLLAARKGGDARFPLALNPSDFTLQPDLQAWIAADPLRNQSVTGRFLMHSLRMVLAIRRNLARTRLSNVNLFLAAEDPIIRNEATRRLVTRLQADRVFCRVYPDTRHSLVLEVPERLAGDLISHTVSDTRPSSTGHARAN